eukprot:TRINITY_DN439_c1_g1_i1.p1 TRINITY_DN439_c1_g1~~TRINITY_DN439_c1_g1_i1.p1  ORF type:complete len:643 (+),score=231.66 TRINITY_DN439_c1_g1_i1:100-1929(+)
MDSKGNLIGFGKQAAGAKRRKTATTGGGGGGGGFGAMLMAGMKKKTPAAAPAPVVAAEPSQTSPAAAAAPESHATAAPAPRADAPTAVSVSAPAVDESEEYEPAPLQVPGVAPAGVTARRVVGKMGEVDLPVTHHVALRGHDNAVVSLDLDRTGTRLITGGMDFRVKLWQFAGMDTGLRYFKGHEPHEGYPVNDLSFSPTGDKYVASVSNMRPIIFSRDGKELLEFMNGDQYVRQERYTRGHTAVTHSVRWCPDDEACIITAGADGTVRLWDSETVHKTNKTIIVHGKPSVGARKAECRVAELNGTKKAILSAGTDGRLCVWPRAGPFLRPSMEIQAHQNAGITGVACTADGRFITTRGDDATVKLWDVRNPKAAVAVRTGLETYYDTTGITFGHGDRVIATGTGADPREGEEGRLVLLSASDLSVLADVPVGVGSVSKVKWNAGLNQLFVGCQDGGCHVFYNPVASTKGILLSLAKKRKYDPGEVAVARKIVCPESEREIKEHLQQAAHKKPSVKPYMLGPGQAAAADNGAGHARRVTSQQAFLMEHLPQLVNRGDTVRDEDPQEALAKYAEQAKNNPQFVDQCYKDQPKIFQKNMDEGAEKRKWENV